MGITVDPTFVPPAPPEQVTSPDGLLVARVDAAHAGVALKASFAGESEKVLRTNHATNPGMRSTSGEVVVATNLMPDSGFEYGMGGFNTGASGWAASQELGGNWSRTGNGCLLINNTGGSGPATFITIGTLTPSTTYTFAAWVRPSGGVTDADLRAGGDVADPHNATTDPNNITPMPLTPIVYQRVSLTFTTTATPTAVVLYLYGSTSGDVRYDDLTLNEGTVPVDDFSGDTLADDAFTFRWTGIAGGSTSQKVGRKVAGWIPVGTVPVEYQRGTDVMESTGQVLGSGTVTAAAGQYWAYRVKVRATGPDATLRLAGNALSGGLGGYAGDVSAQNVSLPSDGSWLDVEVPSMNPVAAGGDNFRASLNPTLPASVLLQVKDFMPVLVSGPGMVPGPYFDGSTTDESTGSYTDVHYRWTGVVDASTSEAFQPAIAPFDPLPQKTRFFRADGSLVRSGDPAWAPGGIAIAYDHEAPVGTAASYYAVPVYRDGSEGAQTDGVTVLVPWTAGKSDVWLKSPVDPNRSVVAHAATFEETARPFRNNPSTIPGSRLGTFSWDVTGGLTGVLTVSTDSRAEYDALVELFEGGPILMQTNPDGSGVAQMYALPSGDLLSLRRVATGYGWGLREWPITLTECRRPATLDAPYRVPGASYADTDPDFPTYQAAIDTGTTYLDEEGWA